MDLLHTWICGRCRTTQKKKKKKLLHGVLLTAGTFISLYIRSTPGEGQTDSVWKFFHSLVELKRSAGNFTGRIFCLHLWGSAHGQTSSRHFTVAWVYQWERRQEARLRGVYPQMCVWMPRDSAELCHCGADVLVVQAHQQLTKNYSVNTETQHKGEQSTSLFLGELMNLNASNEPQICMIYLVITHLGFFRGESWHTCI